MKGAQSHFILRCSAMQLVYLFLLMAVPGAGMLLMAMFLVDGSVACAAYWGAGLVSLVTLGWVLVVLVLSVHTGFYWTEVNQPEDWR